MNICRCVIAVMMASTAFGASVIDSGTSEPLNPVTGQEFYHTDKHKHEIYDSGEWVEQDLGIFNVKAFGAKGDGVTDDTAAIQAAIDSIGSEGGVVFLPLGSYKLTDTITLRPLLRLKGSTRRGGTHLMCQHEGDGFVFSYPSETLAQIMIENMQIEGFKGSYSTGHGIYFKNGFDAEFRSVVINNFPEDNIRIEDGWHIYIRDVYSAHAGSNCFYIDGASVSLQKAVSDAGLYSLTIGSHGGGADVRGCHFEGAFIAGIRLLSARQARIVSNLICVTPRGIVFDGSIESCRMNIICANSIGGCDDCWGDASLGITGVDLNDATAIQNQISDNIIMDFRTGIRDYSSGYNIINGNIVMGSGTYGSLDTGLNMNPATGAGPIIVSSNVFEGTVDPIRHNSGDRVMYTGNVTVDGSGTLQPINVLSGDPIIIPEP